MVDVARPGMGTGDSIDLGSLAGASRGDEKPGKGNFSAAADHTAGFAAAPDTFGNSSHGGRAKTRQIKSPVNAGGRMFHSLRKLGLVSRTFVP
ncbi:MAG: hypothetical protein K9G48_03015 [Reyranella sp.]|nr:hypothetical protein [Reyranella sp.]